MHINNTITDDCGYTPFDYEVERARDRIIRRRSLLNVSDEILEALADDEDIKEIMEEEYE